MLKHIVIVYKPSLSGLRPDVIGYYSFDTNTGAYAVIKDLDLKLRCKCEEYDDNLEVESIVYYCEE